MQVQCATLRSSHVDCGSGSLCGSDIVQMLRNCHQLRSLTLSGNDDVSDSVLEEIVTQHSQLKVLNIAWCEDLTSRMLKTIARYCTTLVRLDNGSIDGLDAAQLAHALCQMPNLRWLNVSTAAFQASHWAMIFDHCSLLQYINISFTDFTAATMTYMGQRCPHMKSVVMHGEGTDSKVAALAKALPKLQALYLLDSCELTSLGIIELARYCKDLRKLDLSSCCATAITNESVMALSRGCSELRWLDLTGSGRDVSDKSITLLALSCTKLETIKLPYNERITEISITALAHNCPRLVRVQMNCTNITDTSIIALSTHCIHLQCLVLSYHNITDAALFSLATHLPGLRVLTLRKCPKITSAGIEALTKQCTNLVSFVIEDCEKVDNACATTVVLYCRRLRVLELLLAVAFADVYMSSNILQRLLSCERVLRQRS